MFAVFDDCRKILNESPVALVEVFVSRPFTHVRHDIRLPFVAALACGGAGVEGLILVVFAITSRRKLWKA